MSKVHVFGRPLIQHKSSYIRDKNTGTKEFGELVDEVGTLMVHEVTRDLWLQDVEIGTPIITTAAKRLAGKKLATVSTLRAGLGMADGVLSLVPIARVGHIELYRDPKTLKVVGYFAKLPQDIDEREIIVVDPILTTGASAIEAINSLKSRSTKNTRLMCLIAAPEGIEKMQETHKDVDTYIVASDEKLNERAYIIPGLGSTGDRLFDTK